MAIMRAAEWLAADPDPETQGELTVLLGRMGQAVLSFLTSFVITFMLAGFLLVDLERVNGFGSSGTFHR